MMQARPTIVLPKSFVASRGGQGGRETYCLLTCVVLSLCMIGCSDNVRPPTTAQIAAFEAAAPMTPKVDMERVRKAKLYTGPYRVVPYDVLEFTMPALLRAVTEADVQAAQTQDGADEPFICRVSDTGTITLPAVGELEVAGKSLAQVEEAVVEAYEPYVVRRPSVYARVLEYRTGKVYIAGAVQEPGVYTLRSDQMTLVSLLTEAGGIAQAGAALVRVIGAGTQEDGPKNDMPRVQADIPSDTPVAAPPPRTKDTEQSVTIRSSVSGPTIHIERSPSTTRSGEDEVPDTSLDEVGQPSDLTAMASDADRIEDPCRPARDRVDAAETKASDVAGAPGTREDHAIVLPVVGMNIPFEDVALTEGDTVVVEPIQMPTMSILGLVRNPGNFPYPPYARYNLSQAIALAGGLVMEVDPRYATIYRPESNGNIRSVTFRLIEDGGYTKNLNEPVRPGDLIAVEHTPRTRTNEFINRFFRLSIGTWVDVGQLWE